MGNMTRSKGSTDPEGKAALAFREAQEDRRAQRLAHRLKRWKEYDRAYVMGGLAIAILVLAYLLLAFRRLGGSWF